MALTNELTRQERSQVKPRRLSQFYWFLTSPRLSDTKISPVNNRIDELTTMIFQGTTIVSSDFIPKLNLRRTIGFN